MANLVTFKGETYDITDFIPNHPGGSVIQKAIGNDLEQVWKENGVEWHMNNSRVMDTLAQYKVIAENLNNPTADSNTKKTWGKNNVIVYDLVILFALLVLFLYFI